MSKPTRYTACGDGVVMADPAGPLVKWEDYQRLDDLCKQLMAQHSDISCENIRLRKAGDAMAETLEGVGFDSAMDFWNAANREQGCLVNPIKVAQYLPKPPAKEGKQP